MNNSGSNKHKYQQEKIALKMSPQMSNSRHILSNIKPDNTNNQPNSNSSTINQLKSYQGPITAPKQVSQYLTQQLHNQLKVNQNHLVCTCPPEVHKALLEQQMLQHRSPHQHFQPCPHQRPLTKAMDPHSMYTLINYEQSLIQPQIKTTTSVPFTAHSISSTTPQHFAMQSTMSRGSGNLQNTSLHYRQTSNPENMVEARDHIIRMEAQLMYLTSWIQNNQRANNNIPTNGSYETRFFPVISDSATLSQLNNSSPYYFVASDSLTTDARDNLINMEATPSNSSLDSAYSAKSTNSSDNNAGAPRQLFPIPDRLSQMIEEKLPVIVVKKLRENLSQLNSIREDISALRKLNQSFKYSFKEEISGIFLKIKKLLENTGLENIPVQKERQIIEYRVADFTSNVELQIDKLEDLEMAIEDLRMNVLNRRCRVNIEEVEVLALNLSRISKDLAVNKTGFPDMERKLNEIMQTEMDIVKTGKRFLETEPRRLENALRLCKKLISTLFTLKRLGSVQENTGSDGIPEIRSNRDPQDKDKRAILDEINAILPNNSFRMQQIMLAEKLRECRKKMLTSHESLKFEKSLELAAKNLKRIGVCAEYSADQVLPNETVRYIGSTVSSSTKECDSLSSFTDSDLDVSSKTETLTKIKELSSNVSHKLPQISDLSHNSSSDTSNDPDSSDNALSARRSRSSKHGTILKTLQHPSRANRSSKVAFNRTVTVEGGSEVLQLNCPEDDYDQAAGSSTPPQPPPRLSSEEQALPVS